MSWIEVILSSGLIVTLGGWVWTAGKNKQKCVQTCSRIDVLEVKVSMNHQRLDKHDIQYATIDAKLDMLIENSKNRRGEDG